MPRCQAITKSSGKQCQHNAKRRYCVQHREVKSRGVPASERSKPKPSRKMDTAEKVKRWGKVVAHYRSRTSGKTYSVRQKSKNTFSCNCPGWVNKRPGEARSCRHVIQAADKVSRSRTRSRARTRRATASTR